MNKEQFLAALGRRLGRLPPDERERVLAYYREMIEDKVESGETEEEAVFGLGNIASLTRRILAENPNRRPRNTAKIAMIAVVSLLGACVVAAIVVGSVMRYSGFRFRIPAGAAASRVSDSYVYKTQEEKADGIGTVSISAENKAVIVEPWDSDGIQVDYATDAEEHYEFSTNGGTFSVRNTESGWDRSHRWGWGDNAPTITVRLPKRYSGTVFVDTTNSSVKATDFENLGDLHCVTTNSEITVKNLTAKDLEFQTQNAAIELTNVAAAEKISAETQNAQIGLDGISAPDISLHTQNALITGTIRGREEDYTVEAHTTNAISNLRNRSGGSKKLLVETTNAIISVSFEN